MKHTILNLYPVFHRFTVFLAVCYLGWSLYTIEVELPEMEYLIQVLLPSIFDTLTGGHPLSPHDFVNN
jgi:hypothetical protein